MTVEVKGLNIPEEFGDPVNITVDGLEYVILFKHGYLRVVVGGVVYYKFIYTDKIKLPKTVRKLAPGADMS